MAHTKTLGLFFVLMTLAGFASAQVEPDGSAVREDYSAGPFAPVFADDDFSVEVDKYQWLFELLIPASLRTSEPERSWKSFAPHIKDSIKFFPHPDAIAAEKMTPAISRNVLGRITYVGMFPRKYSYQVTHVGGEYLIEVKVHFRGATTDDLRNLRAGFVRATDLWNAYRPQSGFQYRFNFAVSETAEGAHFAVGLADKTRGPYDVQWSRNWTYRTFAHELGHMMGLGDEYQTLSGKIDCLVSSLMCDSWQGSPTLQHYYHILRRVSLEAQPLLDEEAKRLQRRKDRRRFR